MGDGEGDPGGEAATGRTSSLGVCGIGVAVRAEAERKPRQESGEAHSCLRTSVPLLTPLTSPAPPPCPTLPHPSRDSSGAMQSLNNIVNM